MSRDLGDWETPPELADSVLSLLRRLGIRWSRVLEPTCGRGTFIAATLAQPDPPSEVVGIDIQATHLEAAQHRIPDTLAKVTLLHRNIFETDFRTDVTWSSAGPLLVVGNPPWVTSSELGSLGSANLPQKSNLKGLRGLDAITGAANFDIAEFITLKLISELAATKPTIALLLKTAVARSVIRHCRAAQWPLATASLHRFDAKSAFGAAVDACVLVARVGDSNTAQNIPVYPTLEAAEPTTVMGFPNGELVADIVGYRNAAHIDGTSSLTWRQGVKHDAASVMELERDHGSLRNKLGELVDVELDFVFPLVKGTQLYHGETRTTRKHLIIPQRRLGDSTISLVSAAPRLWAYLTAHSRVFDSRRSSIYANMPPFSVFGIGDYTYAPYKVAVSGLHKTPRFRALGPIEGKPVAVDDTSYLLPCDSPDQAALLVTLLAHPTVAALLSALLFPDSKRPITKRLLQRIDLHAVLRSSVLTEVLRAAQQAATGLGSASLLPTSLFRLEELLNREQLPLIAPP